MVKEELDPKPNTPSSSTKQSSSTKKKPPSHAKQKAKQMGKHITFRIPDALDTKIMRPDFATTVPENKSLHEIRMNICCKYHSRDDDAFHVLDENNGECK